MADLTPEQQSIRRAAISAKRIRKKLLLKEKKAREMNSKITPSNMHISSVTANSKPSSSGENFEIKEEGCPKWRSQVSKGHLNRMAFTVSSDWTDIPHEKLIRILELKNPELPSGALTFVSRTRNSGGGWTVLVDVDRSCFHFLKSQNNKLSVLIEMVCLRPAKK